MNNHRFIGDAALTLLLLAILHPFSVPVTADPLTLEQALEFDRAQARYELELETDFGDALVGQSESQLLNARTEFELALQWANLAILTAQPYSPISRDYNPTHEPIE